MAADRIVEQFLASLDADVRCVASGEWGVSLDDVGGWPLHVGLALRDGLLQVQCEAAPAAVLDAHDLLHRNRRGVLVRYTHTSAGAVWVQAELPVEAVTAQWLDRVLGLVVEAAVAVRVRG